MRDRSIEPAGEDAWRGASVRGGAALEAYGRALRCYGRKEIEPENLARETLDLWARGATEALVIYAALGERYYRWTLSNAGVEVLGAGGSAGTGREIGNTGAGTERAPGQEPS